MQPVDWRTRRPGFQRRSYNGSHSNRSLASPAFGGCSFLRDSRAERHSAVQRSPRSHSSASLRSRSAVALSSWARASLRYRIARALLMASQILSRLAGPALRGRFGPRSGGRDMPQARRLKLPGFLFALVGRGKLLRQPFKPMLFGRGRGDWPGKSGWPTAEVNGDSTHSTLRVRGRPGLYASTRAVP